jgi:hypothetical protein
MLGSPARAVPNEFAIDDFIFVTIALEEALVDTSAYEGWGAYLNPLEWTRRGDTLVYDIVGTKKLQRLA